MAEDRLPFNPRFAMDLTSLGSPVSKKARIEIIPLIDVIFFLLATFVLFTLSLDKIRAIEVPLPKVPLHPVPPSVDTTVYLQASDGAFYWKQGTDGIVEMLTAAEIRPRLENYRRTAAEARVFVRGDGQAKFGAAVALLDEVRAAGIKQVSVETLVSRTGH